MGDSRRVTNRPPLRIPIPGRVLSIRPLLVSPSLHHPLSSSHPSSGIGPQLVQVTPKHAMRVTIPNPLGPPVTVDTDRYNNLSHLFSALPLPAGFRSSRRAPLRLLLALFAFVIIVTWAPAPPFPPSYAAEWARERSSSRLFTDARVPEGRDGRYVK
jgi:hypothetical protein